MAAVLYSAFFGSLLLLPLAIADGLFSAFSAYTWSDWSSLVFLGVFGTAAGFTLYYLAIRDIGGILLMIGVYLTNKPTS